MDTVKNVLYYFISNLGGKLYAIHSLFFSAHQNFLRMMRRRYLLEIWMTFQEWHISWLNLKNTARNDVSGM